MAIESSPAPLNPQPSKSKSVETKVTNDTKNTRKSHRCRNICLTITGVFVFIVLLIVTLLYTVFKAKQAVTTINNVALDDLKFALDLPTMSVRLNFSLNIDLSIKNPNNAGFKYQNTSVLLYYKKQVVGEVPVVGDKISANGNKAMNVTLTLMADRLLSNAGVYGEIVNGTLPLSTYTKISGKVIIINIIKIHIDSENSCDFIINALNGTVLNSDCKSKTSL